MCLFSLTKTNLFRRYFIMNTNINNCLKSFYLYIRQRFATTDLVEFDNLFDMKNTYTNSQSNLRRIRRDIGNSILIKFQRFEEPYI
jgi:hypothetical protein